MIQDKIHQIKKARTPQGEIFIQYVMEKSILDDEKSDKYNLYWEFDDKTSFKYDKQRNIFCVSAYFRQFLHQEYNINNDVIKLIVFDCVNKNNFIEKELTDVEQIKYYTF